MRWPRRTATPARYGHGYGVGKLAKGPHLRLVWLSENVDEVHGVTVMTPRID